MEALQRSDVSFRRQGSSGLVWDDKFLKELNQESERLQREKEKEQAAAAAAETNSPSSSSLPAAEKDATGNINKPPAISINTGGTIERSRSNGGGRGYRTGRVSPAIEPPSPRVSACGFCSAFSNKPPKNKTNRTKRPGKRRSRPL